MAAARTPPDDAVLNIAKWLERFGFGRHDHWADRRVDKYAFWVAIVFLIAGVAGIVIPQFASGPGTSPSEMGPNNDNGGIITQGQHGDNSFYK